MLGFLGESEWVGEEGGGEVKRGKKSENGWSGVGSRGSRVESRKNQQSQYENMPNYSV